MMEPRLQ